MMKRISLLMWVLALVGACLFPAIPALADSLRVGIRMDSVSLGIHIGEEPRLVLVPGTPVYEAPSVPYNYFYYEGRYYLYQGGAWLRSATYNGPWTVIAIEQVPRPVLVVPAEHYKVRPDHWKRHGPPPWAEAKGHGRKYRKGREGED